MSLAPGTMLAGKYRVIRQLGEGGMGSVYQVEDARHPGRVFAAKELLDDGSLSPEDLTAAHKRFDDEIAMLAHLAHPRLPAYVDSFTDAGRRFFVMEYIPGMTMEQRLRQQGGPLPERDVLVAMSAVCDVLAYLHTQRPPIIVRDLKPGNIMLTPSGEIRMIDLGIARTFKVGKVTNTENLGTMAYASPEHMGLSQTDVRSDVYSLGATMYHLLTNHEPTPLETPVPGAMRAYAPGLSQATENLVIRAMRQLPPDRFQSAVEMRDALRAALKAVESPAPRPTRVGAPHPIAPRPIRPPPIMPARQPSANRPLPSSAGAKPAPVARAAAPAAGIPASPATPAGHICPKCGYVNRRNARFCRNDGYPLGVAPLKNPGASVIPAAPTTAELHERRATEEFKAGHYQAAVRQSEIAIAEGRATPDLYLLMGRSYRQMNRPHEAATAFEQSGKLRPSAEALYQQGMALRAAGELDAAELAFSRSRQMDPKNAEISYQLGLVCLAQGRFAQAEGELRDALATRVDDPSILVALGRVEAGRGDLDGAIAYYRRAIAVAPSDGGAHTELGQALMAQGKLSDAIRTLDKASRLAPQSAEAFAALGAACLAVGRRAQARTALKRAAELDPNDAEVRQLLTAL
ncbi:MAG TPA: tetratricopeptide repeat protein [Ktedonobacterales bacterium]